MNSVIIGIYQPCYLSSVQNQGNKNITSSLLIIAMTEKCYKVTDWMYKAKLLIQLWPAPLPSLENNLSNLCPLTLKGFWKAGSATCDLWNKPGRPLSFSPSHKWSLKIDNSFSERGQRSVRLTLRRKMALNILFKQLINQFSCPLDHCKQKIIFCSWAPPPNHTLCIRGKKFIFVWNGLKGSRWAPKDPKWSKTLGTTLKCVQITQEGLKSKKSLFFFGTHCA